MNSPTRPPITPATIFAVLDGAGEVGGDVESFEDGSAEVAKKDPELTELETNGVGVGGAVGGKESTVGDGDVVRGAVGVPRSDGSESEEGEESAESDEPDGPLGDADGLNDDEALGEGESLGEDRAPSGETEGLLLGEEDGDGGGVCELAELGEFVGEDVTGELEERASSEELEPESEVEIEEAD